jgi:N-acyl-D-amino-acid deacylase
VHPRFYGSFPRVLGRYVREQKIMSWEQAIKKSSWLPAATIGMSDRGLIALGMAADIVVFDPNTIIDHATYDDPALPSEGVKHVFVNGGLALKDGVATGARSGRVLARSANMPSRPASADLRSVSIKAKAGKHTIAIELTQGAGVREAKGVLSIDGVIYQPGFLQTTREWASIGGSSGDRAISVTIDQHAATTVIVTIDGQEAWRAFPVGASAIRGQ